MAHRWGWKVWICLLCENDGGIARDWLLTDHYTNRPFPRVLRPPSPGCPEAVSALVTGSASHLPLLVDAVGGRAGPGGSDALVQGGWKRGCCCTGAALYLLEGGGDEAAAAAAHARVAEGSTTYLGGSASLTTLHTPHFKLLTCPPPPPPQVWLRHCCPPASSMGPHAPPPSSLINGRGQGAQAPPLPRTPSLTSSSQGWGWPSSSRGGNWKGGEREAGQDAQEGGKEGGGDGERES